MKGTGWLATMVSIALAAPVVAQQPGPDGAALYGARCGNCHNGRVAKAPPLVMMANFSTDAVLRAMETGVMRQQAAGLAAPERLAVAKFMTGKPPGATSGPQAPVCSNTAINLKQPPKASGWGVDLANRRFSGAPLTSVRVDNLSQLKLRWAFAFPDTSRMRSQPTVAGDSIFIGSQGGKVMALDRATGCIRWTFTTVAEVRTAIVVSAWDRTDPGAQPLAFFGDLIGNVYAVNARTGALQWRDRPDQHPSLTITAAPALYNGTLYVALSSLEVVAAADPAYECCTFRGGVVAYDSATGKRRWTGYTIASAPVEVSRNAVGTRQLAPSGAPIWGTPTIDAKRGQLYVGTGESYSSPASSSSDAILALSLADGSIVWRMQATPDDAWNMGCETDARINCPPEDGPDYDFGAPPVLTTDSNGRDVLLAGQKSGAVFGIDPGTGKMLWTKKLGRGGIQGGVHFGMSLAGDTLYVPMSDFDGGPRWPGRAYPGMFAIDIRSGGRLWYTETDNVCADLAFCDPGLSAAVSALPGGVIAGAMDGRLRAYDQATGAVVWSFNTLQSFPALGGGSGRGGSFGGASGPVFDGNMMLVTSGYGLYDHMPGNVLLAFTLPDPQ